MDKVSILCHDIVNCLNSVVVIAGVLRDTAKTKTLPADFDDILNKGLKSIEDAALKADKYLQELRSHPDILRRK